MNHKPLPRGYRLTGTMDFMRNRRQMKIVAYSALAAVAAMVGYGLLAHPAGKIDRVSLLEHIGK